LARRAERQKPDGLAVRAVDLLLPTADLGGIGIISMPGVPASTSSVGHRAARSKASSPRRPGPGLKVRATGHEDPVDALRRGIDRRWQEPVIERRCGIAEGERSCSSGKSCWRDGRMAGAMAA
jgi:hypothetical protein